MKRKYKCPYCDYAPSRKWNLKKHLISVHRVENKEIQDNLHDVIQSELQTSSHCPVHRQANYHPEYLTSTSNQNQSILDPDESTTVSQDNFTRYTPMYPTESYADDVNKKHLKIDQQPQIYDPTCQTITYHTDDQTRYPTESFNPSRKNLISECQPKSLIEDVYDEIKTTEQSVESMIESLQGQYKDVCSICGAEGPYNLMRQHFINCRSNLLKCHECNKTFLSRWKYNIHMKSEH